MSDDKTIRCWDLEQEGKCVRVVGGGEKEGGNSVVHEHFVQGVRWAPSLIRQQQQQGSAGAGAGATNGNGSIDQGKKEDPGGGGKEGIRCVIATASVDMCVRVFAN